MSPLPDRLIDRWQNRAEITPDHGVVYWHILLGDQPDVRELARSAQDRLLRFPGLHMTPPQWLHITTLIAGGTDEVGPAEMSLMLAEAATRLSRVRPITVAVGRVLYHPEAIMLAVGPEDALSPGGGAAQSPTRTILCRAGTNGSSMESWVPHVTLCYSTTQQPAAPIIAELGKELPSREVRIDGLSLVVQRGPERRWDWHPVGIAPLAGR